MNPTYSFIVPIYNEEMALPEIYRRMNATSKLMNGPVEFIFVNDGSRDGSLPIIKSLQRQDSRVCYISFARNFGHQVAVTAGLHYARGEAIAVLDGDLQDPPELIPEMAEIWQQGYQVVYAQRTHRQKESHFKRFTAYVFYRLLKWMADVEIPTDTGDFCLMDRQVVDLLNAMPERHRYIRGLRAWVGFRQTSIAFDRDPRFAGEVKYTFRKSLMLAIDSLISFSKIPLRLSTYLGLISALVSTIVAGLVLYWRVTQPHSPVTGFATILICIFFLGAVQLVSIGILGEYIGHIYEEVKGRPLYTVSEIDGFQRQPVAFSQHRSKN
jgi:polyisoprenyl-phosphate glycosyltransferase